MNNCYIGFYFNDEFEHDISVTLIYNNRNYSIELERLVKIKHSGFNEKNKISIHQYLKLAIDYLLFASGVPVGTRIVNVNYPGEYEIKGYECTFLNCKRHHFLHALSAYACSSFDESSILVIDNAGIEEGVPVCQTMWFGEKSEVKNIFSSVFDKKSLKIGIGEVYRLHSKYVGLEEGSLMGLASFGKPEIFSKFELYTFQDNEVYCNFGIGSGCTDAKNIKQYLQNIYGVDFELEKKKIQRGENIETSILAHIAAKVQKDTEKAILYLAKKLKEHTKSDNICLAGGVALNIGANTRVIQEAGFNNIFVQPASNDAGISLGSALYGYLLEDSKDTFHFNVYAGREYDETFILSQLEIYREYLHFEKINDYKRCAQLLDNGKILSVFHGGSEFGPRALGFRSILANPKALDIKDRLNVIKGRQSWRPVAAMILEEYVDEYFEGARINEFMVLSARILSEKRNDILSLAHADGTCRYQTISKQNEFLYSLLKEFYSISHIPLLINTSFNVHQQPIVESPKDAIETFLSTTIDYLLIGDFLVSKSSIQNSLSFNVELPKVQLYYLYDIDKVNLYYQTLEIIRSMLFPNSIKITPVFVYDGFGFDIEGMGKITICLKKEDRDFFYTFENLGVGYSCSNLDDIFREILHKVSEKVQYTYPKILEKILICFEQK